MRISALIPLLVFALVLVSVSAESLQGRAQSDPKNIVYGAMSPESKFVTANGIRIHYLEWGRSGSYIILLHGMNGDAQIWKDLAPIIASDHHVVAPDRRGTGKSDKPNEGYDFETLVNDVALLSENLKVKSVILIGHSFGAQLALMVAARRPELVSSVILIDGGFWPKKTAPDTSVPSSEIEKTSRGYDPESVYPKTRMPVLMVIARGNGPAAEVIAQLKEKGIDYFDEVRKAEQGATDLAKRKLSRGEITVIENTGHNIQVDQPQKLAEAIKQFLLKLRLTQR